MQGKVLSMSYADYWLVTGFHIFCMSRFSWQRRCGALKLCQTDHHGRVGSVKYNETTLQHWAGGVMEEFCFTMQQQNKS